MVFCSFFLLDDVKVPSSVAGIILNVQSFWILNCLIATNTKDNATKIFRLSDGMISIVLCKIN